MIVQGRAWKLGDNLDTDQLVPGRYLTLTEPNELAVHCLEDTVPEFRTSVKPGDIIVAGENFGCGSSREHAPIALKALGISCVIARSFARIFFRNCINTGLPALTIPEAEAIRDGDELCVDLSTGRIDRLDGDCHCLSHPLPDQLRQIVDADGLTSYVAMRLRERRAPQYRRESTE